MAGQSHHAGSLSHTLGLALATASLVTLTVFLAPTTPATAASWQLGAHEPSGSATLYRDCPAGKQVGAASTIATSGSVNFSSNRDLTSVHTACG